VIAFGVRSPVSADKLDNARDSYDDGALAAFTGLGAKRRTPPPTRFPTHSGKK
jgi:hypothetical protein